MASYTTNYQLHQWEASDSFLRTDFNTDFQKIDAAIKGVETAANTALAGKASTAALEAVQTLAAGKSRGVVGVYTGDGTSANHISLGATPMAVIMPWGMYCYVTVTGFSNNGMTLEEGGFCVSHDAGNNRTMNKAGADYEYLAII